MSVTFIAAKVHGKMNGYYSNELGFFGDKFLDTFCVRSGRREYVVECSDPKILEELKNIENTSYLFQDMKKITNYLKSNNIEFEIINQLQSA